MSGLLWGAGGMLLGGVVVAACVHLTYAWRGWQAARRAVPIARQAFAERLGGAVVVVGLAAAVILACAYLAATGRPR